MTDVVLNEGFGITFENNDMKLFKENSGELIAQRLEIKLSAYKGEWFLDRNAGIPWIQELLSRRGTKDLIDANVKRVILSDEDIKSLDNYSSQTTGATLKINFDATLKNGDRITNVQVSV